MTNFEKWLKEKGYSNPAHNDAYELGRFDGAREGWRAALRWVLKQETKKPLLGNQVHKYIDSIVLRNELERIKKS